MRVFCSGESSGEQNHSTKRAGLVAMAAFALSKLLHTSTAMKPTNRREKDAQWR